jgi:hypothetical protein
LGHDPADDVRTSACLGGAGRVALVLCANLDITSGPARVSVGPALFATTAIVQSLSVGYGFLSAHAAAPDPSR